MSPKGAPYDNAALENFFSCLKCELIHLKHYPTRASAQADVFAYMEAFYNTVRPHSALGWLSPTQFEAGLLFSGKDSALRWHEHPGRPIRAPPPLLWSVKDSPESVSLMPSGLFAVTLS